MTSLFCGLGSRVVGCVFLYVSLDEGRRTRVDTSGKGGFWQLVPRRSTHP